MRKRALIAGWLLCLASLMRAGEVVDRVIATVNGRAVLESDLDDEVRYECFMSGRPLNEVSAADRKEAFDRLVDQELLSGQMRTADFKPAGDDEVAAQMAGLKAQYPITHAEQSWGAALASYGLTEATVREHVAREISQLKLVDARLRPLIQVDPAEVETYYRQQFLPRVPAAQAMSLQEATPKIRELLVQEKINQALSSWLESLRAQAKITILAPQTFDSEAGAP